MELTFEIEGPCVSFRLDGVLVERCSGSTPLSHARIAVVKALRRYTCQGEFGDGSYQQACHLWDEMVNRARQAKEVKA